MSERDAFMFEVAPRHDAGGPAAGRGLGLWRASSALLLAVLLSAGAILVPLLVTVAISFLDGRAWPDVLSDGQAWQAIGNTVLWWVLVVVVCAVGLGLAWLARNAGVVLGGVMRFCLVLPAAISPIATGAIFRLLFDTDHHRGLAAALAGRDVAFLGPGWIWPVMGLAFVWQWAGIAFLVFHEALARLPHDLLRMARAFGVGRRRRLWSIVVPALAGPAALAYLFALVAAARVFDLVLMGVPGSMQPMVEGGALFWWRHNGDLGDSRAAAYALLLSVVVAVMAAFALFGLRGRADWTERVPAPRAGGGRQLWPLCVVLMALWLLPFVALVLTSLREPADAALSGWWNGGPWTLGSYADAWNDDAFRGAFFTTCLRALAVAGLVLLAAVPAAYVLAHEHLLPRRTWRPVLLVLVALAALPPQAFAVPLQRPFSPGSTFGLALVHAALVIPLAVLVLHNAFVRVPVPMLARDRWELLHVVREARPAVVLAGVLAFVLVWNDTVVGLLFNWPAGDHLPLILLAGSRHFATAAAPLAAQTVIATVVPVAVVLLTGHLLYRGLTQGVRR